MDTMYLLVLFAVGQLTSNLIKPCPDSPNCVSTTHDPADATHYIAPIGYSQDEAEVLLIIKDIVNNMPRSLIVKEDAFYLHAEFRSRIFRFVDDVEFYLDTVNKRIHFRSAARLGYGDFGVNRRRMEEISRKIEGRLNNSEAGQ
ncbi:MAG: DUF1499 domain-containing protein [Chloroflexi bacterium AL-N5]|nr:DUF1499 domain-containing protein [Chloroflexi bacterium AL-N5]